MALCMRTGQRVRKGGGLGGAPRCEGRCGITEVSGYEGKGCETCNFRGVGTVYLEDCYAVIVYFIVTLNGPKSGSVSAGYAHCQHG
jgi:hypothetical protein